MKKIIVLGVALALLMVFSTTVWGLNTPSITKTHGVITGRYANDIGFIAGCEYGFGSKLAVTADVGGSSYTRISLKYELRPTLALEIGLLGSGNSRTFFGINGSTIMSDDLQGIIQADLSIANNELSCNYELGLKFDLDPQLDLRGGVMGIINNGQSTTNLQLGVGYHF